MNYLTEFKIQQLRTKNLTAGVESVAIILGAVIANMLVPQLLLKYVYDPTTLLEAPPIFEYFPLFSYTVALAYFIFAMGGNFMRNRKARTLEQELLLTGGGCCEGGSCSCDNCDDEEISEKELKELEKIVDEALKPTKAGTKVSKKTTKKKTAKKA